MGVRGITGKLAALLVIVAAAASGSLAAGAVGLGAAPEEVAAPDPAPVPGSDSVEAQAADPAKGPPWAIRVYEAIGGQSCSDFGRVVGGRIGLVDGAGAFHERRPADAGGNCGDPDAAIGLLLAADYYPDDPTTDAVEAPRTVVHGIAGRLVDRVRVGWPDGAAVAPLSPRRGFISVYGGAAGSVPVTVDYAGGRSQTFDLTLKTG
jgi:hypothetical protein